MPADYRFPLLDYLDVERTKHELLLQILQELRELRKEVEKLKGDAVTSETAMGTPGDGFYSD
jgi:hypothetical protein